MVSEHPDRRGNVRVVEQGGKRGRTQLAALLFEPGKRPDAAALAVHSARGGYTVSLQSDGWAELLKDGLTFDLAGLAPGDPSEVPPLRHSYGLSAEGPAAEWEALSFVPGPHLAGAEHLLPVVRVAAGLLLALADLPGLAALSWCPAHNVLSPEWFRKAGGSWLEGGPFPAFALASLLPLEDGRIRSEGLAFLTGQEFVLEGAVGGAVPPMGVAVRLLDWLVAQGKIAGSSRAEIVGVGTIALEPGADGIVAARCR